MNYIRFHNYQYVGTVDGGYDSDDLTVRSFIKNCVLVSTTQRKLSAV